MALRDESPYARLMFSHEKDIIKIAEYFDIPF